mgnify:CR=1 FL=1
MKKLILVFLFFLALWFSFAQDEKLCGVDNYIIDWYANVKKDQFVEYSIKTLDGNKPLFLKSVTYRFFDKDKLLDVSNTESYATYFESLGAKKLQVDFVDGNWCKYKLSKDINVYKKLIVYIWNAMDEFELWFDENFLKHSVLFDKIILDSEHDSSENLILLMSDSAGYLKSADKIIISSQVYDRIFDVFHKLIKSNLIDFSNKNIYLVANDNKVFLKRILTKYLKPFKNPNIFVVEKTYLLNFLSNLSFDKTEFDNKMVYNVSLDSESQQKYYFFSRVIDYLIYQWMSVNLISFLLVLSISILIISFLRQFVWFSVFGVFYPLMFSISLLLAGIKLSLVLLVIAFVSTFVTKLFVKKIYLLHNAKIALLMIFYVCLLLLFIWLERYLWWNLIDFQMFDNMFMIFPLIFVAIIWDKIFSEWFRLFSFWSLFSLIEFLFVSFISYFLINRSALRHMMIAYPEIVLLVFVLNLIVWRFTGLQVLEYFRFIPLIRKQFEEE